MYTSLHIAANRKNVTSLTRILELKLIRPMYNRSIVVYYFGAYSPTCRGQKKFCWQHVIPRQPHSGLEWFDIVIIVDSVRKSVLNLEIDIDMHIHLSFARDNFFLVR